MVDFHRLDPRRFRLDAQAIVGDSRIYCTVYRRPPGGTSETEQSRFWARISKISRQTVGIEQWLPAGTATGSLWVMHAPPGSPELKHDDQIWTSDDKRWRVVFIRKLPAGQIAVVSNIQ